jgi:amidase
VLAEISLADAAKALADGEATSVALTRAYLARIAEIDKKLNSVLAFNPHAIAAAEDADARRASGKVRSVLDGIPLLIKDNIDTAGLATTAGSLALANNIPAKDASLVVRLKEAGAVIIGKTNLSEWANIRSRWSVSGWSAVGGLTRNPYALDRSPCGSSSGSAVAVAANLAAGAVGTETDGSIVWPAAITGIVGLKPTVGLVSRAGIIPISHSQDTPGPMARCVRDAALLLGAMVGTDPDDPATAEADARKTNYAKSLEGASLTGVRLGVLRSMSGFQPRTLRVFQRALDIMRAHGAVLIDIDEFDMTPVKQDLITVLLTEFKVGLNAYLHSVHKDVKVRTLEDVIAFNGEEPRELVWFGQDFFEVAQTTTGLDDPVYIEARARGRRAAGADGIDRMMAAHGVEALLAPTNDPAWLIDPINGDHFGGSVSTLPAVAGYPHLTVPMGTAAGLPLGISFIGGAWSEARLLALGHAFEKGAPARIPPRLASSLSRHPGD